MATATAQATTSQRLFEILDAAKIPHQTVEHQAVMTVEEQKVYVKVTAPHTKNLFLKDNTGKFWLVSALDDTKVDLKTLATTLKVKSVRFATPEALEENLGVQQGAVSIFAMINDEKRVVTPILDERLFEDEQTAFHPLRNTATTVIPSKDLRTFFQHLNREFRTIKF